MLNRLYIEKKAKKRIIVVLFLYVFTFHSDKKPEQIFFIYNLFVILEYSVILPFHIISLSFRGSVITAPIIKPREMATMVITTRIASVVAAE